MEYAVITEETCDSGALPMVPSGFWVLSTLEIALTVDLRTYLLLVFPSYAFVGLSQGPQHDEGYWAPPFVAYPIPFRYSSPCTVGSLRRMLEPAVSTLRVTEDLDQLCYQMGLRDVRLEQRGAFLELKMSPRSPGVTRGYYILRHGLVSADESSLRNLADPEVRRGYVYLPIEEKPSSSMFVRFSSAHGRNESWFLGKPLQSNIEYVLSNTERRASIVRKGLSINAAAFVRSDDGLLCVVDLEGFGSLLEYARESMHSFNDDGAAAETFYRQNVIEQLQSMVGDLGSTQMQIVGDGFIAAFPGRVFPNLIDIRDRVLKRWKEVILHIEKLNRAVRDPTRTVGSRIVLHAGRYRYGRIAGPRSFSPSFDGAPIVEVVRLEQATAITLKSLGQVEDTAAAKHHVLTISAALEVLAGDLGLSDDWTSLGAFTLTAKEYAGKAKLYRLKSVDSGQLAPSLSA